MEVMRVRLSALEFFHGAHAGFMRNASNLARGMTDDTFSKDGAWGVHILGSLGEFATACAYGLLWRGPGTFRGPDVAERIQVRTTKYLGGHLPITTRDDDGDVFVFVIQVSPLEYDVKGWIEGHDAKRAEWWREPPHFPAVHAAAYFVPQGALCTGPLPQGGKDGAHPKAASLVPVVRGDDHLG